MLSATNKRLTLSVVMLNVVVLSVFMLNVMAPTKRANKSSCIGVKNQIETTMAKFSFITGL